MGLPKGGCIIINEVGIVIGGKKGDKVGINCQSECMDFYVILWDFVRNEIMEFYKPRGMHIEKNASGLLNMMKSTKDINDFSWPVALQ